MFNKVDRFRELEAGQEDSGVMQIPRDFSSDYQVRDISQDRRGTGRTAEGAPGHYTQQADSVGKSFSIQPGRAYPDHPASTVSFWRRNTRRMESR